MSFFLKEFWTFFILQRLQNKLYKFSQYLLLARMFVRVGRCLLREDTKVRGENPRVKADDHNIFSNTRIELGPQRWYVIVHYATWTVNSITFVEISFFILHFDKSITRLKDIVETTFVFNNVLLLCMEHITNIVKALLKRGLSSFHHISSLVFWGLISSLRFFFSLHWIWLNCN